MPRSVAFIFLMICAVFAFDMLIVSGDSYYDGDGGKDDLSKSNENEKNSVRDLTDKRSSSIFAHRIGCIPRGGRCDYHKGACCNNTACRCNFWGTNCRCQRIGLFQKWG